MNMRPVTVQTQKQTLTPFLKQSISVLMLSVMELHTAIEQELQSNPMLESEGATDQNISNSTKDNPINDISTPLQSGTQLSNEDIEQSETPIVQNQSLEDHLMTQLRIEITNDLEYTIGELIIGNLDADGYLASPIEEIALLAKTDDIRLVEKTLQTIQTFDPVGIASRNIQECLLAQIRASQSPYKDQATIIIKDHLETFFQKKFDHISKKTSINVQNIQEIAQFIATLEPKPARNFQGAVQTVYAQPDVYLFKDQDGNFQIEINKRDTPTLRVNPLYMKLLKTPSTSANDKKFLKEKMTNALNFIKSISQRGETLKKISLHILEHQRGYFEGTTTSLQPLTLKDIAFSLGRNESTISRAIHHKYIQTPLGLFPLRYFFSNAVNAQNKSVSAQSIKEEIKTLIDTEDKNNPLSDQSIVEHFREKGIPMARRTINKYRQQLDISPSSKRRKRN